MINFKNIDKGQFPRATSLAANTNGSPFSVTLNAIKQLKEPQDIVDFAHEMVSAYALEIPIKKAVVSVGALISFALVEFDEPFTKLWESALPQADLKAGHFPGNESGAIHYRDGEDLKNQLDCYFDNSRK